MLQAEELLMSYKKLLKAKTIQFRGVIHTGTLYTRGEREKELLVLLGK